MRLFRVLRSVALFEAAKGLVVLLAGAGLLTLLHKDVQSLAEKWISHSRLNPASHYPRVFIDLAANLKDSGLWLLAGLAALYATVRFIEAYGLWRGRTWAEWFAALSGGIYIPLELRELILRANVWSVAMLTINVAIVAFMIFSIRRPDAIGMEDSQ